MAIVLDVKTGEVRRVSVWRQRRRLHKTPLSTGHSFKRCVRRECDARALEVGVLSRYRNYLGRMVARLHCSKCGAAWTQVAYPW